MKKINNILSFRILPQANIKNWVIGVVACFLFSPVLKSQWLECPQEERRILIGSLKSVMVTDENGGAIVVGEALSTSPHLFAQKVDNNGFSVWDPDNIGLLISPDGDEQTDAKLISDGEGGAYVGFTSKTIVGYWEDNGGHTWPIKDTHVLLQKISSNGVMVWNNGVNLAEVDTNLQKIYGLAPDGEDGVLVVYNEYNLIWNGDSLFNNGAQSGVFLQRLDYLGNKLFGESGILITDDWDSVQLVNQDGLGGVYVIADSTYRFNNLGERLWTIPNNFGFEVDIGFNSEDNGIILTGDYWYDYGIDRKYVLKSQKIGSNGDLEWGEEGLIIDTMYVQWAHNAVTNGNSGAIFAFTNNDSIDKLINIDEWGTVIWDTNPLTPATAIVPDLYGGVVYTCINLTSPYNDWEVWRVSNDGQHQLDENGVTYSTNAIGVSTIAISDYNNGILISREQASTGGFGRGIYLKKMDQWGILGGDGNYTCGGADINLDEVINILDIINSVNIILEVEYPICGYQLCAADANVDHNIDILDIILIVNIILEN